MLLELAAVGKDYPGGTRALVEVDLSLEEGAFLLLTGASGAGKSTLLHLAGLLDDPTRGEVRFEGIPVARLSAARRDETRLRRIGFVFQHHFLAPDLTVLENVALPGLAAGTASARRRAEDLLRQVGLAGRGDRLPRELSGGEQQRAGVARALINRPSLLLADEPTGNLDAESASTVAELLAEVNEEGTGVLLVTHDPDRFPQAHERFLLAGGRISRPGPGSGGSGAVPTPPEGRPGLR